MGLAGANDDGFARSRAQFEEMIASLGDDGAAKLDHGELEDRLDTEGRELLRQERRRVHESRYAGGVIPTAA